MRNYVWVFVYVCVFSKHTYPGALYSTRPCLKGDNKSVSLYCASLYRQQVSLYCARSFLINRDQKRFEAFCCIMTLAGFRPSKCHMKKKNDDTTFMTARRMDYI